MTDEQGEAIYRLKTSINTPLNGGSSIIVDKEDIETVLNMLKEKDKEIAKYEKIYKEYDCYRWVKELEKKDKIIDLMAETIRKLAISLANYKGSYNKETINFTGNIKDIKQYFERKVENETN